MKEFRREISAVRPNNRVKLRMDVESLEDFNVLQGFENGSLELIAKINVSFSPIAESEVKSIVPDPFRLCHSNHVYSSGGMG
jgi:hypothetical protein